MGVAVPHLRRVQFEDFHHDPFPARKFFSACAAQFFGSASGKERGVVPMLVNKLLRDFTLEAVAAHGCKENTYSSESFRGYIFGTF